MRHKARTGRNDSFFLALVIEEKFIIRIDFKPQFCNGFTNIFVLTSDNYWSLSTVNPLPFLKEKRRKIIKETGKAPDVLIFASDLIDVFIQNPFIVKSMDVRHLQNVEIKPRIVDDALTLLWPLG